MSNRNLSTMVFLENFRFGSSVDNDIKNKPYCLSMCDTVVAFICGHAVL